MDCKLCFPITFALVSCFLTPNSDIKGEPDPWPRLTSRLLVIFCSGYYWSMGSFLYTLLSELTYSGFLALKSPSSRGFTSVLETY